MGSPLLANRHHQLSPRWFVIKLHFQTLLTPLTQVRNSCLCWMPQLEKGGEEANTCTHCWNYCWLSGCAETTPNGDFRMTEVAGPLFLGVRRLRSQSKPAFPSALALQLCSWHILCPISCSAIPTSSTTASSGSFGSY